MAVTFVFTLIGPDRPGLVNRISETISDHGGLWEESRFIHLGGRFAGVASIEVANADANTLARALEALEREAPLHVTFARAGSGEAPAPAPEAMRTIKLDGIGPDRPGVVRDVTGALAALGANIEDMTTHAAPAPMGGGRVFQFTAEVRAPKACDESDLLSAAEAAAADFIFET